MSDRVFAGAAWVSVAAGIGKLSTLIAQVFLGWLLTKEDFGIYAILLSLSMVGATLRNGGTQQLLIHKGARYNELAPAVFRFGVAFNLLAFLILMCLSLFVSNTQNIPALPLLAFVMAISYFIAAPGLILKAKIQIDGLYRQLAIATAISNITRQMSAIVFALLGFGVFSFVIPMAIEPIMLALLCYSVVRSWPKARKVALLEYRDIFHDTKWIMCSNLAMASRQNGQFFLIALYVSMADLGLYFFATQLVISLTVLVSSAVNEVIFPSLSKISENVERHKKLFLGSFALLLIVGGGMSVMLIVLGPTVIDFVWNEKWNHSVVCMLYLSTAAAPIMLSALVIAMLASKGLWKLRLLLLVLAAIGELLVAGFFASKGGIVGVAQALPVYQWCVAMILFLVTLKVLELSLVDDAVPYIALILSIMTIIGLTLYSTLCFEAPSNIVAQLACLSFLAAIALIVKDKLLEAMKTEVPN